MEEESNASESDALDSTSSRSCSHVHLLRAPPVDSRQAATAMPLLRLDCSPAFCRLDRRPRHRSAHAAARLTRSSAFAHPGSLLYGSDMEGGGPMPIPIPDRRAT